MVFEGDGLARDRDHGKDRERESPSAKGAKRGKSSFLMGLLACLLALGVGYALYQGAYFYLVKKRLPRPTDSADRAAMGAQLRKDVRGLGDAARTVGRESAELLRKIGRAVPTEKLLAEAKEVGGKETPSGESPAPGPVTPTPAPKPEKPPAAAPAAEPSPAKESAPAVNGEVELVLGKDAFREGLGCFRNTGASEAPAVRERELRAATAAFRRAGEHLTKAKTVSPGNGAIDDLRERVNLYLYDCLKRQGL
ncbi:MAG: hypothetical protein V1809_10345 [Planctomycetota bacterium]